MSTRSTVASCTEGRTNLHLYHEMHDDLIHLEISDEQGSKEIAMSASWFILVFSAVVVGLELCAITLPLPMNYPWLAWFNLVVYTLLFSVVLRVTR